jgi:hypothetical protein
MKAISTVALSLAVVAGSAGIWGLSSAAAVRHPAPAPAAVRHPEPRGTTRPAAARPYALNLFIVSPASGPRYLPGNLTLPAHRLIRVTLRSDDNGASPAPGFTTVRGTVGGVMKVDGRTVRSVAPGDIAHTFTVIALGLNVPVPPAPAHGYVTVTFSFRTGGPGVYLWECFARCGNGLNGWGGPMSAMGDMEGVVRVVD